MPNNAIQSLLRPQRQALPALPAVQIVETLQEVDSEHGSDAFTLFAVIWEETNGDTAHTFVMDPESMVGVDVIPHWPWERYVRARAALLNTGLLINDGELFALGHVPPLPSSRTAPLPHSP